MRRSNTHTTLYFANFEQMQEKKKIIISIPLIDKHQYGYKSLTPISSINSVYYWNRGYLSMLTIEPELPFQSIVHI